MTFTSLLSAYIGRTVEIVVTGAFFEGTLTSVGTTVIQIEESPTIYGGPPVLATIPSSSIDLVRILA